MSTFPVKPLLPLRSRSRLPSRTGAGPLIAPARLACRICRRIFLSKSGRLRSDRIGTECCPSLHRAPGETTEVMRDCAVQAASRCVPCPGSRYSLVGGMNASSVNTARSGGIEGCVAEPLFEVAGIASADVELKARCPAAMNNECDLGEAGACATTRWKARRMQVKTTSHC